MLDGAMVVRVAVPFTLREQRKASRKGRRDWRPPLVGYPNDGKDKLVNEVVASGKHLERARVQPARDEHRADEKSNSRSRPARR